MLSESMPSSSQDGAKGTWCNPFSAELSDFDELDEEFDEEDFDDDFDDDFEEDWDADLPTDDDK